MKGKINWDAFEVSQGLVAGEEVVAVLLDQPNNIAIKEGDIEEGLLRWERARESVMSCRFDADLQIGRRGTFSCKALGATHGGSSGSG